jgi:predicted nucleic acid-binding protein
MRGLPFIQSEAWNAYQTFCSLPEVQFKPEPLEVELQFSSLKFPHSLWTDAYLAAFATTGRCRIVSFDSDFSRFEDLDFLLLEG